MAKITIIASGVADLTTAVAALMADGSWSSVSGSEVVAVIIGHRISLPDNLIEAFRDVAVNAFDLSGVEAFRWGEDDTLIEAFTNANTGTGLLAANQLQDPKQRKFIAALKPKQLVFYDNGISSYAPHNVDLTAWVGTLPDCDRFVAYLSYMDKFGAPPYLNVFKTKSLSHEALVKSVAQIRKACVSDQELLPPSAVVILGTSFDRTKLISIEDEQMIHKKLLEAIRVRHSGPCFFKPHPRASQAYLTQEDGVTTLSTELPIEAYVSNSQGVAYSFSSTALFSLSTMYGWRTHRVEHVLIEKVFNARPQLAKVKVLKASSVIGDV